MKILKKGMNFDLEFLLRHPSEIQLIFSKIRSYKLSSKKKNLPLPLILYLKISDWWYQRKEFKEIDDTIMIN